MCQYDSSPEFKWFSSSDVTTPAIGLHCTKLATPPHGVGPTAWYQFWKLLRLINIGL